MMLGLGPEIIAGHRAQFLYQLSCEVPRTFSLSDSFVTAAGCRLPLTHPSVSRKLAYPAYFLRGHLIFRSMI